jgi:hypothetical protein
MAGRYNESHVASIPASDILVGNRIVVFLSDDGGEICTGDSVMRSSKMNIGWM